MTEQFIPLKASGLMDLIRPGNLDEYADGLALIDDLLCSFDSPPRKPGFLPLTIPEGLHLGHPELISPELNTCIEALREDSGASGELARNLEDNFSNALSLLERMTGDSRSDSQAKARRFLSGLLSQYATVVQIDPHTMGAY